MTDKGIIIRPAVSRDYVALPNAILSDRRMSIEARGLVCFVLSKSKNFEIRPWALAKALSTEAKRLGRTKLERMLAEGMTAGYVARTDKQPRKADGSFRSHHFIVGMPDDVAAEVERLKAAALADARNPQRVTRSGSAAAGGMGTLSTKDESLPNNQSTNHQHHQSGQPAAAVPTARSMAGEDRYSPMGEHAKANGLVFVYVGSTPYNAWKAFKGDDGMPFVDVAIIGGTERRGSWFVSMYPRGQAARGPSHSALARKYAERGAK